MFIVTVHTTGRSAIEAVLDPDVYGPFETFEEAELAQKALHSFLDQLDQEACAVIIECAGMQVPSTYEEFCEQTYLHVELEDEE